MLKDVVAIGVLERGADILAPAVCLKEEYLRPVETTFRKHWREILDDCDLSWEDVEEEPIEFFVQGKFEDVGALPYLSDGVLALCDADVQDLAIGCWWLSP